MQILDGKLVSSLIKDDIKKTVDNIKENNRRVPTLATILVGNDEASMTYVHSKHKTAKLLGFDTKDYKLSDDESEDKLISLVHSLNDDKSVDAILIQLPLPKKFNTNRVLSHIAMSKDVDGITENNIGHLALDEDAVIPCTPYGILLLLQHYNIPLEGKHVVVLGRSRIVGRPLSLLLNTSKVNATVTCCNSRTENLKEITRTADVLISAIGRLQFIKSDFIKDGAVVVDVGITRHPDPTAEKGYRILGDVDFDDVKEKASYITPVPGGVGPLTIACLMKNTLLLYKKHEEKSENTN